MQQKLQSFEFETFKINRRGEIIERNAKTANSFVIPIDKASLEMVEIPSGSFIMGSTEDEAESRGNERPVHKVRVPRFFMSKFTITQNQWKAALPSLPKMDRKFYGDELPVVNVWLEKALEFCFRLKKLTNLTFRLPNEAEWEYACRAGTTTPFNFGETISTNFANYNGNKPYNNSLLGVFRHQTTPAGYFKIPNALGLYDMHGNVWEWCADIWHEDYAGAPTDGSAWITNGDHSYCVQRGGSWLDRGGACRSAFRVGDIAHNADNTVGLRICLSDIF